MELEVAKTRRGKRFISFPLFGDMVYKLLFDVWWIKPMESINIVIELVL